MPAAGKGKQESRGRVYVYRLSAGGQWSYGKNPMTDPALVRQFYSAITRMGGGDYVVNCEGELCRIRVEDAPSFVEDLELREDAPGRLAAVTLHLASGSSEPLDPATLETGRGGALYCMDSRGLRARFHRTPHLALSRYIEDHAGRYLLPLAGERYEVRVGAGKKN